MVQGLPGGGMRRGQLGGMGVLGGMLTLGDAGEGLLVLGGC